MIVLRVIMSKRESELIKTITPYLRYNSGKTTLSEDAPEEVKKAYEEYLSIPPEPEVY